jgi:hypothetical protein
MRGGCLAGERHLVTVLMLVTWVILGTRNEVNLRSLARLSRRVTFLGVSN